MHARHCSRLWGRVVGKTGSPCFVELPFFLAWEHTHSWSLPVQRRVRCAEMSYPSGMGCWGRSHIRAEFRTTRTASREDWVAENSLQREEPVQRATEC